MEFVKTEKAFSLYVNGEAIGVPKNPTYGGDLIQYKEGMRIRIGKTVSCKELTWKIFRDGERIIWLCDRNLVSHIERQACDELIKSIEIDGQEYLQTLPDAGCGTEESFMISDWAQMIAQLDEAEKNLHTIHMFSNTYRYAEAGWSILIGYHDFDQLGWAINYPPDYFDCLGWRPVLIQNCDERPKEAEQVRITDKVRRTRNTNGRMQPLGRCSRFSLYINGQAVDVPQDPKWDGDLIHYREGMNVEIGNSVSGKELTWQVFQDGSRRIWVCDRNLINWISRDDCDELIKLVNIMGQRFKQSIPDAGYGTDGSFEGSDWGLMIDTLSDPKKDLHIKECYSFSSEYSEDGWSILVGYYEENYWYGDCHDDISGIIGWRPVLIEDVGTCDTDMQF